MDLRLSLLHSGCRRSQWFVFLLSARASCERTTTIHCPVVVVWALTRAVSHPGAGAATDAAMLCPHNHVASHFQSCVVSVTGESPHLTVKQALC